MGKIRNKNDINPNMLYNNKLMDWKMMIQAKDLILVFMEEVIWINNQKKIHNFHLYRN
jgi:hypothetical protein